MKKWIVMLTVLLVAATGCSDRAMTAWVMTGSDTDVKALVGTEVQGIEAGAVVTWTQASDIAWGPEPTGLGFYIAGEASWLLTASDTGTPAPPGLQLLDGLTAVPYGRVEWLDAADNDNFGNLRPQYIAGTKFLLDEDGALAIVAEYSTGDFAPPDAYIGVRGRF
jgi:hypothetical protein